ncbi:MAG: hypothetical protein HY959_07940 [Ignavibacteriae bacterium]|nr:hypothetical protein [Ignavibacteriota bacterium]
MKHRIYYSTMEHLYHIQTKSLFSGWKNRENYFFTDSRGNVKRISGFETYDQAIGWLHDRYPGLDLLNSHNSDNRNTNIGFEF